MLVLLVSRRTLDLFGSRLVRTLVGIALIEIGAISPQTEGGTLTSLAVALLLLLLGLFHLGQKLILLVACGSSDHQKIVQDVFL